MRMVLCVWLSVFLLPVFCRAQEDPETKKYPISYSLALSFHAVATPLHRVGNNFRNLGLKVGAERPWNRRDNLRQSLELGYYFNRLNGRGFYLHSDVVYRPRVLKELRLDFRLGPGVSYVLHPTPSFVQKSGEWVASHAGKLFFEVHGSFGLSYNNISIGSWLVSPFVQYEVMGLTSYNRGISLFPNSFIHIGSRFKF